MWGNEAIECMCWRTLLPHNNYYINRKEKTMREAYKIQNVNQYISKVGLIRMYKNLLANDKIRKNGPAHRRLMKFMNEEDWWDKV